MIDELSQLQAELKSSRDRLSKETADALQEVNLAQQEMMPTDAQIEEAKALLQEMQKRGIADPKIEDELNAIINYKTSNIAPIKDEQFNQPPLPVLTADIGSGEQFNNPPLPVLTSDMGTYTEPTKLPVYNERFNDPPLPVLTAQMDAPINVRPPITNIVNRPVTKTKPVKKYKSPVFAKGASRL